VVARPEIRNASAVDVDAVCAIYNAAINERSSTFETEPRSDADFRERVRDETLPFLVAAQAERVIGWAAVAPYSARRCYAGIVEASIYVSSAARGRGVGTALAHDLATDAERRGFHKLIGKLFTDNVASIRLVERCGFRAVGVHSRHGRLDGAWRDVLVVERLLGAALS
jgi:phosphinothricin acetyltransferase